MARSGVPDRLNWRVIFIVRTLLRNVFAVRIIQAGETRVVSHEIRGMKWLCLLN